MGELKAKDLLKCKNRAAVLAYAKRNGLKVTEGSNYVYVDYMKCVFNHAGKLLFVQ